LSDEATTIQELKRLVGAFRDARDWAQFHSPKNLSMAIAIEAAELMAEFQWLTTEESVAVIENPQKLRQTGREIADIMMYCLSLADSLGIDIADAIRQKIRENAEKYPEDEYKGRY
jgi:NTP pyrophosphatase (non-canonical NTP hydrolase)